MVYRLVDSLCVDTDVFFFNKRKLYYINIIVFLLNECTIKLNIRIFVIHTLKNNSTNFETSEIIFRKIGKV